MVMMMTQATTRKQSVYERTLEDESTEFQGLQGLQELEKRWNRGEMARLLLSYDVRKSMLVVYIIAYALYKSCNPPWK